MRNAVCIFLLGMLISGCSARRVTVAGPQGVTQECSLQKSGKLACSPKALQELGQRHFLIVSGRPEGKTLCEIIVKPGAVLAILPDGNVELNGTDVQVTGCRLQWVNGTKGN